MHSITMRDRIKQFFSGFRKAADPALVPASDKNASPMPAAAVGSVEAKEQGDVHLGSGDFAAAAQCYRRAVAADPRFAKAYCNLAFALKELGQHADAEACVDKALAIDPANVDAHYLKATLCQGNDRLDDACRHFRKALELAPNFEFACRDLCFLLFRRGRIKEAQQVVAQAIAFNPANADLHFYLGNLYFEGRQFDSAASSFRACLSIQPERPDAYANLGLTLLRNDELDEAIAALRNALRIDPNRVDTLSNLGNAFQQQGKFEEALDSYRRALQIDPDNAQVLINSGAAKQNQGMLEEAIAYYRRALTVQPKNVDAHFNLAIALEADGQADLAIAQYRTILQIDPNHLQARYKLGLALQAAMQHEEAIACFDALLTIDPNFADAGLAKGLHALLIGNFSDGWKGYEYRWQMKSGPVRPQFAQPQWTGREDLSGKTILVYGEQGFGDTIQFVRYVEKLAAIGATVVLEIQPELIPLLSTVPSIGKIMSANDSFPPFDYHCSLLSLPLAFNTELSTIPATESYIFAKENLVQFWREKLSCHTLPKIGIVWSGDPKHANDARRSIRLEAFAGLCSDERYRFFSLQKAVRDSDAKILNAHSAIIDLGPELRSYEETAAIISNLDIVITVDTSVAHLAGALGKPVWILLPHLPDFRWLLERADSPWYPSARLFRQPSAGDWGSVIEDVHSALASRFADENQA